MQDGIGRSALMYAAGSGLKQIVGLLLGRGADVRLLDHCGEGAISLAEARREMCRCYSSMHVACTCMTSVRDVRARGRACVCACVRVYVYVCALEPHSSTGI